MRFNTDLAEKYGLPSDRFPLTEEEVARVEEILALEMDRLSLEEHEKFIFDVHGFGTSLSSSPSDNEALNDGIQIESSDMQDKFLDQMDLELRKLSVCSATPTSAYGHALYLNPDYVQSSAYRLLFLRDNEFDPKRAAEHYIKHFEIKRQYFDNEDVLGRHVRWSDLGETEQGIVKIGFMQILPSLDTAGRRIAFVTPAFKPTKFSFDQMMRARWYLCCLLTCDEDWQKNDTVLVVYCVGDYGSHLKGEFDVLKQRHLLREALPFNLAADHFCYDDEANHPYVSGQRLFTEDTDRLRMRTHFGNKEEVTFEIQTYGIPTDEFPINNKGTLEVKCHMDFLKMHQRREAKEDTCNEDDGIVRPRRFDVLLGKGRHTCVHTGNVRLALIVEMHHDVYEVANKHKKTEISERIIGMIHASHGRFLRFQDGCWAPVEDHIAREKISHLFRRLRTNRKLNGQEEAIQRSAQNNKRKIKT